MRMYGREDRSLIAGSITLQLVTGSGDSVLFHKGRRKAAYDLRYEMDPARRNYIFAKRV